MFDLFYSFLYTIINDVVKKRLLANPQKSSHSEYICVRASFEMFNTCTVKKKNWFNSIQFYWSKKEICGDYMQ